MRRWDRKQLGFFILLAAFVLLSVSVIAALAHSQAGEPATAIQDLTEEEKAAAERAEVEAGVRRPEQAMRPLAIPGVYVIPQVSVVRLPMQRDAEALRQLARELPHERRLAALLLSGPMDPVDAERMLQEFRLRFRNDREAIVMANAIQAFTLSNEALARQQGGLATQLQGAALQGGDIHEGEQVLVVMLGVDGELVDLAKLADDPRVFTVLLQTVDL